MVEKTKVSFYNMVPIIQKFENRVFLEKKALSKPLKRSKNVLRAKAVFNVFGALFG